MKIKPIEDNNSNFDLVEIRSSHASAPNATPHCRIHGAMNCVAVHATGKLWRCIQSNMMKDCRAGCEEMVQLSEEENKNVTVRINGKVFYCECGCNVFNHPKPDDKLVYECNACGAWWRGAK